MVCMPEIDTILAGGREIAELQTRFLFPVRLKAGCADVGSHLEKLSYNGTQVWERQEKLGEAYLADLAREAREILQGESAALEYFTVQGRGCSDGWFGREWDVFFQPKSKVADLRAKRDGDGIQLFVFPEQRSAILSITLRAFPQDVTEKMLSFGDARNFIYKLSQIGKSNAAALALRGEELVLDAGAGSPLNQRLGKAGARFTLDELADYLTSTLPLSDVRRPMPAAGRPVSSDSGEDDGRRGQSLAYTVARLPMDGEGFRDAARRGRYGVELAGLAQIEEAEHALAIPELLPVAHELLTAHHWTAVSYQGSAHLVADQNPAELPFNKQRVPNVRDKWFVPFLLSLWQRTALFESHDEAVRLAKSGKPAPKEFQALRERVTLFSLAGHFTDASTREAHLRYYGLCQKGQRVQETLRTLRATIQAIDQSNVAREQSLQLKSLNDTQERVEWIELFIISFYAAELSKTVSEMFRFEHGYAQWSVIATAAVALVVAFFLLGLGGGGHVRGASGERKTLFPPKVKLLLLAGAFVIWFLVGYFQFRPEHAVAHERPKNDAIGRF